MIAPVEEFNVKPGGSEPVDKSQAYAGVPPDADSVCEYEVPTAPSGREVVSILNGAVVEAIAMVPEAEVKKMEFSPSTTVKGDPDTADPFRVAVKVPLGNPATR